MTVAVQCPDRASLAGLLETGAAPDEVERLAAHLESCTPCGETVEALLANDPTTAALRGAKVEPDGFSIPFLRARLANLRPGVGASAPQDATSPAAVEAAAGAVPPPVDATPPPHLALAPPLAPDEIGRLGGYRILKELGRGGMGVVYQAEDVRLKRLVALKAMLPNLAADAVARQRFLREAQAMAAVRHDHVVTVFQVDEVNGVPFLAMEFLQGMPLDQWLKEGRKPTVAQVLRIGREMAEGLAAAHERGLIHRDIKPGNVWLDSAHKGRVKILDFGLARAGQEDVHLTRSGAIVGTPAYMAPEQARGDKVDPRSDLFSLGCVLYRLCTGALPFAGDTTMSLLMALALDHPKPVRELNSDAPAELSDLVMKLLEKDPARRPATAREVVQALQALERPARKQDAEDQTEALPVAAASPAAAVPRRRRRVGVLVSLLLGGAAVAAAAAIIVIIRDKDGNKITEVNVPPGGKVEVVDDGKKGDAAGTPKVAVDDAWLKEVAGLSTAKQVAAVVAKLKERNPGFDGQVAYKVEDGVVRELGLLSAKVNDIGPVRALTGLHTLSCPFAMVSELTPLKDMKLTHLDCHNTMICDLSPLKGMPLTYLDCYSAKVDDLDPLKGMKLTHLHCACGPVSDLSPLKGMPLTYLNCAWAPVSDLSPLKDMPLTTLYCDNTKVSDLSPLKGLPLKELGCDFKPERDAEILRSLKTLETINGTPAAEFWKDIAVAAKPPLDDAWVKQVAALPADKQVEAVVVKLKAGFAYKPVHYLRFVGRPGGFIGKGGRFVGKKADALRPWPFCHSPR